jgi:DnaK suppressor protein
MDSYAPSHSERFSQLLAQREVELRAILRATGDLAEQSASAGREVSDFKDVAATEILAGVDEAHAEHAAIELEQVLAARRRLEDGSYGYCIQCGQAIDLRRLTVLPATPYCVACQTAIERAAARR